jgi:hypothetical protein
MGARKWTKTTRETHAKVARRLKRAAKRVGATHLDVSEELGCTPGTVRKWFAGEAVPTRVALVADVETLISCYNKDTEPKAAANGSVKLTGAASMHEMTKAILRTVSTDHLLAELRRRAA